MQQSESANLLWEESAVRSLFRLSRVYPSYIGVVGGNDRRVRGAPPVLLWREQRFSMQFRVDEEVREETTVATREDGRRKRKREHAEDHPPEKRRAVGVLGALVAYVQSWWASQPPPPPPRAPRELRLVPVTAGAPVALPDETRTAVYMSLVRQGFLVGPGHLYGGDYNTYERGKDPSSSHSTATVRALDRPSISGRDLLAFTRVQNQVAKSAVLAFRSTSDPSAEAVDLLVFNFRNVMEQADQMYIEGAEEERGDGGEGRTRTPSEPSIESPSKAKVSPRTKRRKKPMAEEKIGVRRHKDLEVDLTALLEEETMRIGSLRGDADAGQRAMLERAATELAHYKREFDALLSHNESQTAQIRELRARIALLGRVERAAGCTRLSAREQVDALEMQLAAVRRATEEEMRTHEQLTHMDRRLNDEIGHVREAAEEDCARLDKCKCELQVVEGTLRFLRQELSVQQKDFEGVSKQARARKALLRVNKTLLSDMLARSERALRTAKHIPLGDASSMSVHAEKVEEGTGKQSREFQKRVGDVSSVAVETVVEEEAPELARYLSVEQVEAMLARYHKRVHLCDYVKMLALDAEEELERLEEEHGERLEALVSLTDAEDEEAGGRQQRREGDRPDADAAMQMRRLRTLLVDDSVLKGALDALRMALPRLICKLTGDVIPEPFATEDLQQCVGRLHRAVTRTISSIVHALAGEGHQLAVDDASCRSVDMSELRRSPRYDELEKKVFAGLMSANVREKDLSRDSKRSATKGQLDSSEDAEDGGVRGAAIARRRRGEGDVLTRSAVKSIEVLLLERHAHKEAVRRRSQERAEGRPKQERNRR